MRGLRITVEGVLGLAILAVSLSSGFGQAWKAPAEDSCSKANAAYLATERDWSSINAEVGFMREELERLRSLRWEIKTTLNVLDDAMEDLRTRQPHRCPEDDA